MERVRQTITNRLNNFTFSNEFRNRVSEIAKENMGKPEVTKSDLDALNDKIKKLEKELGELKKSSKPGKKRETATAKNYEKAVAVTKER